MNPEEIVQAQAQRSDLPLVSYREVALPLFRVDVDLLVLDQKPLPPIQEYILRAVDAGLNEFPAIAGFLGIDETLVRSNAVELLSTDNLILGGGADGSRDHRLKLTGKGRRSAAEAAGIQAIETTLPVWVDGLTRRVLSITGKGSQWFPAGQSSRRGLAEIAASPRRRPNETEIALEMVRETISEETAGRRVNREVIGITHIGRARRFAREAIALAFARPGEDLRINLIVEGEPSEAHDAALARALARSSRRIRAEDWRDPHELASQSLPAAVLDTAAPVEDAEQLETERAELQREDSRLEVASRDATAEEIKGLRAELEASKVRQSELQAKLDDISVRQVAAYEHRGYLDRALDEAKERILIVSPWIRHEVVDDKLIKRFRKALDRGVKLWIGHGISKEERPRKREKGEADKEAQRKLEILEADYPGLFRLTRFGDTHAKVLVCDSRFSILTSFNWLSFRGDETLEFRDERGYYVGLADQVDRLFASYLPRFIEESPAS